MKTFEGIVIATLLVLLGVVAIKNASGVSQLFQTGAQGFGTIFSSIGNAGGGSGVAALPSLPQTYVTG